MPRRTLPTLVVASALLVLAAGCSTDASDPERDAAAPDVTTTSVPAGPDTTAAPASSIRSLRYCEILAISPSAEGLGVQVYSTFPLNDCPDDLWQALDPTEAAATAGTPVAVANGPRYWTIDSVSRSTTDDVVRVDFGGLAMNRYASVSLPGPQAVTERYVVRSVDRQAVMTFFAGRQVYLLIDPTGATYAMQSWSQQVDPTLTEGDLAGLGDRLALPQGWRFATQTLDDDLVVEFGQRPAQVLQDDLSNTYSLVTPAVVPPAPAAP
jgi:hypothetical protein